jgi:hypothetical protein
MLEFRGSGKIPVFLEVWAVRQAVGRRIDGSQSCNVGRMNQESSPPPWRGAI